MIFVQNDLTFLLHCESSSQIPILIIIPPKDYILIPLSLPLPQFFSHCLYNLFRLLQELGFVGFDKAGALIF